MWSLFQRNWRLKIAPTPDDIEAQEFLRHMNELMGTNLSSDKSILDSFKEWNRIFRARAH